MQDTLFIFGILLYGMQFKLILLGLGGGIGGARWGGMASASVGEASGDQSVVWPLPSLDIDPD